MAQSWRTARQANKNSYFTKLEPYYPGTEELGADEMRISFLGTSPVPRLSQACSSVFVELGNGDSFLFDCGSGTIEKYVAVGIPYSRMDKVFLTHLHADHIGDLTHVYCFGPSGDRKSPQYVWGPSRSDIPDPVTGEIYDDGLNAYCAHLREALRWHTESFSFLSTSYASFTPPPWAPADKKDGYDLVPFEVPWRENPGTAYDYNGVKITHFPAVHDRQGAISYKLEWNGLSMIFTGDTKPSGYVIEHATDGVDVLIHEMVVPAETWTHKLSGLAPGDSGWDQALQVFQTIEDSSHTPQLAFGYILAQLKERPRLAVATHFQSEDDTIKPALEDIQCWYPDGPVAVTSDLMVINVTKSKIRQRRAVVSDFAWGGGGIVRTDLTTPKYHTPDNQSDPYAQLDPNAPVIDPALYENPPAKGGSRSRPERRLTAT